MPQVFGYDVFLQAVSLFFGEGTLLFLKKKPGDRVCVLYSRLLWSRKKLNDPLVLSVTINVRKYHWYGEQQAYVLYVLYINDMAIQ
jgi:hypothetical protein